MKSTLLKCLLKQSDTLQTHYRHIEHVHEEISGWPLVRENSGKSYFSSRPGKSQGILKNGQGNFKYICTKKIREQSGNFLILVQNCLVFAGILSICSY